MIKFKPCAALVFVYALLIAIDFLPAAEPTAWGRLMQSTRAIFHAPADAPNRNVQQAHAIDRDNATARVTDSKAGSVKSTRPPVRKVYNPARSVSQYMAQERP